MSAADLYFCFFSIHEQLLFSFSPYSERQFILQYFCPLSSISVVLVAVVVLHGGRISSHVHGAVRLIVFVFRREERGISAYHSVLPGTAGTRIELKWQTGSAFR
jgi:hypothetical protein